jgi:hypothetical protein
VTYFERLSVDGGLKCSKCLVHDDRGGWNGGSDPSEGRGAAGPLHSWTTGGQTSGRGGTSYACLTCFKNWWAYVLVVCLCQQ